jgi:hypothetical protein
MFKMISGMIPLAMPSTNGAMAANVAKKLPPVLRASPSWAGSAGVRERAGKTTLVLFQMSIDDASLAIFTCPLNTRAKLSLIAASFPFIAPSMIAIFKRLLYFF